MKPLPQPVAERSGRAWHRNSSPDALFGALTVVEAALGVVIAELAVRAAGGAATSAVLQTFRKRIEDAVGQEAQTTRFGTGTGEILDGRDDALDAILNTARLWAAAKK